MEITILELRAIAGWEKPIYVKIGGMWPYCDAALTIKAGADVGVLDGTQEGGAGFARFDRWLDMTPAHPDMLAVPAPSTVFQLPWRSEFTWVAATCVMEGADVAQVP